jgi:hypothetical protein
MVWLGAASTRSERQDRCGVLWSGPVARAQVRFGVAGEARRGRARKGEARNGRRGEAWRCEAV